MTDIDTASELLDELSRRLASANEIAKFRSIPEFARAIDASPNKAIA